MIAQVLSRAYWLWWCLSHPPSTFLSKSFLLSLENIFLIWDSSHSICDFYRTIYKLGFSEIRLPFHYQIRSTKNKTRNRGDCKVTPYFNPILWPLDQCDQSPHEWLTAAVLLGEPPVPRQILCASQEAMRDQNLRWFLNNVLGWGSIPYERSRPEMIGRLLSKDVNQLRATIL